MVPQPLYLSLPPTHASISADRLLAVNPLWYQIMAYASPCVYAPFYLFAIPAFLRGRNWIRIPGLLFSVCMFYSLLVILGEELFGEYKTSKPGLILAGVMSLSTTHLSMSLTSSADSILELLDYACYHILPIAS